MKVIITGGSGFIGQKLTAALLEKGYHLTILDHHPPKQPVEFVKIDLAGQELPEALFKDVEAIIHLAGKNIFGRWNASVKKAIYESRISGTRGLVSSLKKLSQRPKTLISASAVGFYGERGEAELDEASAPGTDFLASVCVDWEKEAREAESLGLRTVQVRTAPVMGHGGLLSKMLPIYKLGLGGPIGNGQQWFPWVHMEDIVNIYLFALTQENIRGPVNACSPQQIRNKEFSDTLARVINRPAFLRLPLWALKLRFSDLAEAIAASQKVYPRKLQEAGYIFLFPDMRQALENILAPGRA